MRVQTLLKKEGMVQPATFKARHLGWMLMVIGLLSGGCSGINSSHSVSPLDFLLPGIGQHTDTPTPATPPAVTNSLVSWSGTIDLPAVE